MVNMLVLTALGRGDEPQRHGVLTVNLLFEQARDRVETHRGAVEETLNQIGPGVVGDEVELNLGFDTLDGGGEIEVLADLHHIGEQFEGVLVGFDAGEERAVDLELGEGQGAEIAQR